MYSKVHRICSRTRRAQITQGFHIRVANKKELAGDLALKARQVDYLIQSLPPPEPEEKQASLHIEALHTAYGPTG